MGGASEADVGAVGAIRVGDVHVRVVGMTTFFQDVPILAGSP